MLESVGVSKLADPTICIMTKPTPRLAKGDTTHFIEDKKVLKCTQTGVSFSMTVWRHHCRVSGGIYCDAASNYL